jgi:hypothetical protein
MTRKHYEHLAATLGDAIAEESGNHEKHAAALRVAYAVADALADTNAAYDRERFLRAIGTAERVAINQRAHDEGRNHLCVAECPA